jgi:hypothetical protein
MPNITISLDEDLLKSGRRYAERQQTSLNAIIRILLEQTVRPRSDVWLDESFKLMDRANGNSNGQKWTREDLYHG